MSRGGNSPKLELKLNLSPPRATDNNSQQHPVIDLAVESSSADSSSREMSPESSCVSSSEPNNKDTSMHYTSTVVTTSMVLAGCPRCLMYVMLSDVDSRCPKCKTTGLLEFIYEDHNKKSGN